MRARGGSRRGASASSASSAAGGAAWKKSGGGSAAPDGLVERTGAVEPAAAPAASLASCSSSAFAKTGFWESAGGNCAHASTTRVRASRPTGEGGRQAHLCAVGVRVLVIIGRAEHDHLVASLRRARKDILRRVSLRFPRRLIDSGEAVHVVQVTTHASAIRRAASMREFLCMRESMDQCLRRTTQRGTGGGGAPRCGGAQRGVSARRC